MARSSYLSGKLPNHQREPIHNPNNGRGQEAEEGMRGRKAHRPRVAGGSFTNLGHRESERARGGSGSAAGRAPTGSEFGEAAKKMGKVSLRQSRLATSTSSAFKGNSGEHAFLLPSCFSACGGRMSKPNWSRSRLPLSQERRLLEVADRGGVASSTNDGGCSLPTEVKSVFPLRADLTARRQYRKSSFYRTLI